MSTRRVRGVPALACGPALALLAASCATAKAPSAAHAHATPPPAASSPKATGLVFHAPDDWKSESPSSAMRKAQFVLPRAEGDHQDASLVVFHFGGGGGSKEANLERWAQQFEQPDGRASEDALRTSARTVNGLDVLDVELSGTYVAETAPGSGVRVHEDGWRLLASIVDTPDGPYYVKLVGPGRTLERWASSYRGFVSSLEYAR